jgi:PST family polysaccharide transporter
VTEPAPPPPDLASSVRTSALWSIVAMIVARLLGFASLLVLARLLVPADFGVVAAILVLLGFIELAGDAGMKASVVYEQEHGISRRVQTAFTVSLLASIVLAAAGVLLAPLIAGFFRMEDHVGLFRLASLSVLVTGLGNVQDGLLQRDLLFRRRLVAETMRAGVRAGVSIGLALAGLEAAALVWGMLAGSVAWTLLLTFMTGIRPSFALDREAVRSMGAYGGSSAALAMIVAVVTRLDVILIGRMLGERALGLYSVAFRVPELAIQAVAWQLSTVAFPALSRKRVDDEAGLQAATLRLVRIQALYVVPVTVALSVLATPLVLVLFGPKWIDAASILVPISVLSAAMAAVFPLGDLLKATGRQGVLVALNVATAPFTVLAIVLATPAGLLVVAWGRVGSALVFVSLLIAAAHRFARIPLGGFLRSLGPAAVAGAGMALGTASGRFLFSGHEALEVLAGSALGALSAGGLATVLAPATMRDARESLPFVDAALRRLGARRRRPGRVS